MRIGVLTTSLPSGTSGGAEMQAVVLAKRLSRDHEVTVFTRSSVPESAEPTPHYRIINRCRVKVRGARFIADIAGTLWSIGRRRKSLDVLLAYQTVIDGVIAAIAKRVFGIPIVVAIRSEQEYAFSRRAQARWLGPFVFRGSDTIVVQTKTIRDDFVRALGSIGGPRLVDEISSKLAIVPNGISLRHGECVRGEDVLYVGRLIEAKGVHHLVAAMRGCPGERLVIAGSGPEARRLEDAARGIPNIVFAGRVPPEELASYFERAKILVMPSLRDEGMPNAVMEAMAWGIPVVATRNAGIPDLVVDGETGILVAPGDSSDLANAIRTLAADEALRSRFSRASREAIKRYDWPKVVAANEAVLSNVVER